MYWVVHQAAIQVEFYSLNIRENFNTAWFWFRCLCEGRHRLYQILWFRIITFYSVQEIIFPMMKINSNVTQFFRTNSWLIILNWFLIKSFIRITDTMSVPSKTKCSPGLIEFFCWYHWFWKKCANFPFILITWIFSLASSQSAFIQYSRKTKEGIRYKTCAMWAKQLRDYIYFTNFWFSRNIIA